MTAHELNFMIHLWGKPQRNFETQSRDKPGSQTEHKTALATNKEVGLQGETASYVNGAQPIR